MTEQRLALHNAVGVFPDAERAVGALHMLEGEGIGPPGVSLLGPDRQMAPGSSAPRRGHGVVLPGLGRHFVFGMAVGTGAGAVVAALAGLALTALAGAEQAMWLYAAVAGAVMGQVAGALIALEAAGRKAAMWEQSLHPLVPRVRRGDTLVGVHSDDPGVAERGTALLREAGAEEVRDLDATDRFERPWTRAATLGDRVPSDSPAAPGGDIADDPAVPASPDRAAPTGGDRNAAASSAGGS